jgi:hypothetical protein
MLSHTAPPSPSSSTRTSVPVLTWAIEYRGKQYRLLLDGDETSWRALEEMGVPCAGLLRRDGQELEVYSLSVEQVQHFLEIATGWRPPPKEEKHSSIRPRRRGKETRGRRGR